MAVEDSLDEDEDIIRKTLNQKKGQLSLKTSDHDSSLQQGGSTTNRDGYKFITITNPSQRHIAKNKKAVRSQAMRYARNVTRPSSNSRRPASPLEGSSTGILRVLSPKGTFAPCKCRSQNDVCPSCKRHAQQLPRQTFTSSLLNSPNLVRTLGAGHVDPFASFSTEMRPHMNFLLHFWVKAVGPAYMPSLGVASPIVSKLVPLAMRNGAVLHSLLCIAGGRITIALGRRNPQQWEIYHRGEALRHIMVGLSDPAQATSDEMVAAVLLASGFDVLFGHLKAHEEHMKGLDRMIAARGGVDRLGMDGLLKIMVSWAYHFRKSPMHTPVLTKPKPDGTLSSQVQPRRAILDVDSGWPLVPSGYRDLARRGVIDVALLGCINILQSLVKKTYEPLSSTVSASSRVLLFNELLEGLEFDLENHCRTYKKESRGIEECFALALLLYEHRTLRQMPLGSAIVVELSHELKEAVQRTNLDPDWNGNHKALVWISYIGYTSSIASLQEWFEKLTHGSAMKDETVWNVEEMKSALGGFFDHEKLHGRAYSAFLDSWTQLNKNNINLRKD